MITLLYLTFVGANVPVATVEFGERLTLVRGPSDTGKSFIVDAIDFMLGGQELKDIPEREGYAEVLLGLRIAGNEYTLMRSVTGGAFGLFDGRVQGRPSGPPPRTLSQTHNAGNSENLSMWLLEAVGLAGSKLRKNVRNDTDSLSFRNLAHLVLVDETQMQSEIPPAMTGRPTSKTKEISLLKLILEGDDDSNLIASPSGRDERRLKGARLEIVDQLISGLESRLSGTADATAVRDQAARLSQSIDATTASIQQLTDSRTAAVEALQRDQTRRRAIDLRLVQISGLRARFELLSQQYQSDVERLEMIIEGGTLLGYFESDACPLCGALPEHQHRENFDADSGPLIGAAGSERTRTIQLIGDLQQTFEDLDQNERELRTTASALDRRIGAQTGALEETDRGMLPNRAGLAEFLAVKTKIEASLALFDQLAELQRLRAQIEDEAIAETAAAATAIGARAIDAFSNRISVRLSAWGYEAAAGARYDRAQQDLFADNQFRSAHGKGVRAILHAAFTIALADYCLELDLPHPGFLVLDSPLITYRAPGETEGAGPNRSFATAFYHDLEDGFSGQVVVMENTDPLDELGPETIDIEFTKLFGSGRYGYFRPISD
jgi:hypothetical protein